MTNRGILFSPLGQAAVGQKVYLTDMKRVYTYKITTKTTVNEHEVQWVDDVAGKKLVTLITCASPTEGEVDRIVVQATLEASAAATKTNLAVFA